ncbi:MAG: ABC transporter ATP-binding protein [Lachnospiraceae bacterium]|nr:ABC transporter ATP-binding protein [Lachnospiraceae bacterium]
MEILSVRNIEKSFKKHKILKGVSFSIGEQEIVGFLGPNGSGKSTTIKCICGLYGLDAGEIAICGYDIEKQRESALSELGASIESPALYPQLTGREHLKMMGNWRNATSARVKEMEEYTGIGAYLNKRTATYSMGMKMRLMLAMTLMARPKLIILDEPTNGLDPQAVFELRKEMEMIRKDGSSILFSSHQLGEVEKLADRIIFLKQGELVYDGVIPKELVGMEYGVRIMPQHKEASLQALKNLSFVQMQEQENEDTPQWITFSVTQQELLGKAIATLEQIGFVYDVVKKDMDLEDFYKKIYR